MYQQRKKCLIGKVGSRPSESPQK